MCHMGWQSRERLVALSTHGAIRSANDSTAADASTYASSLLVMAAASTTTSSSGSHSHSLSLSWLPLPLRWSGAEGFPSPLCLLAERSAECPAGALPASASASDWADATSCGEVEDECEDEVADECDAMRSGEQQVRWMGKERCVSNTENPRSNSCKEGGRAR